MDNTDRYKTISQATDAILYKEKNSKFYGYAYPISAESDAKIILDQLRKEHHSARHWCYAYQIGVETPYYRANDDGEPANSAGMPIYGQIQAFELTNVLVVVVRYFGGVKLGVGGLIQAYRTAAKMSLENADIIEQTILVTYILTFEYKDLNKVMRVIREQQLEISRRDMKLECRLEVLVRKKNAAAVFEILESLYGITVKTGC